MQLATTIVAVLVALLSLAAGAAKVALVPNEVAFLGSFGFANAAIVAYGVAQIIGGCLLLLPATRYIGALLAAAGFALSLGLILATGNLMFAGLSVLPLAAAGFVAVRAHASRRTAAANA